MNSEEPPTTREWFGTLLVLAIPVVGLIMLIVWAHDWEGKRSRTNFCRASLLLGLVGIAIGAFLLVFEAITGIY